MRKTKEQFSERKGKIKGSQQIKGEKGISEDQKEKRSFQATFGRKLENKKSKTRDFPSTPCTRE